MSIPIILKRGEPSGFFKCFTDWECDSSILKTEIGLITGVTVKPLTIELKKPGGAEFSLSSSSMQASVLTPPGMKGWPLTHSKERATLEYLGIDVASLETTMAPTTVDGSKVSTVLAPADLSIKVGAENTFSAFIAALLGEAAVTFTLKGTLDAKLETTIPGLPPNFLPKKTVFDIQGLAFNSPITLIGCNGFRDIKFSKLIRFVQDPTSKNFILEAEVTLTNPSDLEVKLGEVKFLTADNAGNAIGTAVFKDFQLKQGVNVLQVTVTSAVANPDELLKVLTTTGGNNTFHFAGYEGSSASKILARGLSKFKTQVVVPGLPAPSAAGGRLIGMSYENYIDADPYLESEQFVLLVQSNLNPTSLENIQWSLLAVTERPTVFPQDHSPLACNVNQKTGVFSMISHFSESSPTQPVKDPRPPGGFQYDPRTNVWSNFTLASGYLWGDVEQTFDLFQWPSTDTLVHVNIGASNSVNLGVLETSGSGARQFVNAASWSLDPHIYGYPRQLVYTKDAIFQFGSVVNNNATGSLRYILTKIPLSGTPQTFKPPTALSIYNATSLSQCASRNLVPKYYEGTLFMFCQSPDRYSAYGSGLAMTLKDGASPETGFSAPTFIDIAILAEGLIQPIGDKESGALFAFVVDLAAIPVYSIDLTDAGFGNSTYTYDYANIPEPYGLSFTSPPDRSPAIIGGSIAGAFVLLALVLYFVFRRRWPVWKRKLGAKLVEMMMKDEEGHHGDGADDKHGVYKIEDTSRRHSFDEEDIGDKILVTEDMEASLLNLETTGYLSDVPLQRHPRPGVVTTLVTDSTLRSEDDDTETIGGGSRSGSEGLGRSRGSMGSSMASLFQQRSSPDLTPSARATSPPSANMPTYPRPALLDPAPAATQQPSVLPLPLTTSARAQHLPTAPELYTPAPSNLSGGFQPWPWPSPSSYAPADSQVARSALGNTPSVAIDAPDDGMELTDVAPPYNQGHSDLTLLHRPSFPTPPTPTAPVFVLEELRSYEGIRPRSPAAILDEQPV
ncbi:hypothetical protein BGZ70_006943 [Mortierella alpina]|uniref:Uncharacterized protein n=1 Tax=Mortierella alpina TaxID=64518 RepID=A0A9P6J7C3_MORAP|nr:hypothetical protein BGZ70_006943 [Mortierella alpina]